MKWDNITTMEELWSNSCAEQGAVLKYGDKVLVCGLTYRGFESAIYEFIETEEKTQQSYIECKIQLKTKCPTPFDDGGDAMKWCYDNVNK